jgi:hypothetical protein
MLLAANQHDITKANLKPRGKNGPYPALPHTLGMGSEAMGYPPMPTPGLMGSVPFSLQNPLMALMLSAGWAPYQLGSGQMPLATPPRAAGANPSDHSSSSNNAPNPKTVTPNTKISVWFTLLNEAVEDGMETHLQYQEKFKALGIAKIADVCLFEDKEIVEHVGCTIRLARDLLKQAKKITPDSGN